MIIISQDKDKIVNFNNVSGIEIYPPTDDTQNFEIDAEKVNGELDELGFYETEKRAKEVLKEIIEQFTVSKIENSNYEYADLVMKVKKLSAYEMPEK